MVAYLKVAKDLKLHFSTFFIKQVPRDQNADADALTTLGATLKLGVISTVLIIHVLEPAVYQQEHDVKDPHTYSQWTHEAGVMWTSSAHDETPDWRQPFHVWLQNDVLHADKKKVRSFKMKAFRFVLIDNILFRKSLAGPYLCCLSNLVAHAVMYDIHNGECGNHVGGRSLSNKAPRQGYFWPTMRKDAMEYVKKCDACQRHAPVSHQPAEPMHSIISPSPFMKWGMDIVGPLPRASGNRVYMLTMTDYFSKWIEAEAFHQVHERHVEHRTVQIYPQESSVKRTGGIQTTPKVATGQTPFSLMYGAEAVIPSEVRVPMHRYGCITEDRNQVEMASNLDTVDELRTIAQIRIAAYKQTAARSYNRNVRVRTL
ncbi:uncharacterized protein LOC141602160 [Silene latifolia]|uniref:uncharacterized protein LOC141602160 n=1 Tax=Silene latifolia TaxID=37657 RepID=UPI003D77768C